MPELTDNFTPRILEIGNNPFMYSGFPQSTEFYSTWRNETISAPESGRHIVTLGNLPILARRLRDPAFDLVVVHPNQYAPWSPRAFNRTLFKCPFPVFRAFGQELLRGPIAAPVAVLDMEDPAIIDRSNAFLMDKATVYFKRELPADHWLAFTGTMHWRVPTPRFRTNPRNRARIAKLRPITLGIPYSLANRPAPVPLSGPEKTVDVFFAGRRTDSSSLRERGVNELLALRSEGFVVDVAEEPLPLDEYLERCRRSWIVWSPSGYGWQCFRTYEAGFCGSVPLISRPTIEQFRPLIEGVQALYYEVEPGGLSQAIRAALADRDRLLAIAAAAREHVLVWHTHETLARYVVETTLQMARAGASDNTTAGSG